MSAKTEFLRPAGFNERRCISKDVLEVYGYLILLANYVGPTIPNRSAVQEALKICTAQHPTLSTVVQASASEAPQLKQVVTMDLDNHLKYEDTAVDVDSRDAWHRLVFLQIHNEPATQYETVPQWRVHFFPMKQTGTLPESQFQVAFVYSHALADGMSGVVFHQSFLHALEEVQTVGNSSGPLYEVKSKTQLLPALDRVTNMPLSLSFRYGGTMVEKLPSFLRKALKLDNDEMKGYWYGTDTRPTKASIPDGRSTAVDVMSFSPEILQRALKACKEHDSRLTALLNHLASRALAAALQAQGQQYTKFVVETSMNLRKVIPQANDRMANYASAILQLHDVAANANLRDPLTNGDWEMIQRHTARLEKSSSTLKDHGIAMLKYVTNFRERTLNGQLEPAEASFGTSNLGSFVDDRNAVASKQHWRLTEMVFSQAGDGIGNPFNMNVASAKDGPLVITLTWWPGMLGVDNEPRLMADVLEGTKTQLAGI